MNTMALLFNLTYSFGNFNVILLGKDAKEYGRYRDDCKANSIECQIGDDHC